MKGQNTLVQCQNTLMKRQNNASLSAGTPSAAATARPPPLSPQLFPDVLIYWIFLYVIAMVAVVARAWRPVSPRPSLPPLTLTHTLRLPRLLPFPFPVPVLVLLPFSFPFSFRIPLLALPLLLR